MGGAYVPAPTSREGWLAGSYVPPDRLAARTALKLGAGCLLAGIVLMGLGSRTVGPLLVVGGILLLAMGGGILIMSHTAGEAAGRLVGATALPSGATTPAPKGYSAIEALAARGEYRRAAEAYEREIAGDRTDAEACVRLAELLLHHLDDAEGAAVRYREARERTADARRRQFITFRLVDIYRDHLHEAGRAIVELRRFLDSFPDAPQAAGARAELARLLAERHGAS